MARATSRVLMTGPLALFADVYGVALSERGYTQRTAVWVSPQIVETSTMRRCDVRDSKKVRPGVS